MSKFIACLNMLLSKQIEWIYFRLKIYEHDHNHITWWLNIRFIQLGYIVAYIVRLYINQFYHVRVFTQRRMLMNAVKSVSIRRVPISWSANCHSRGLFVKSLRISRWLLLVSLFIYNLMLKWHQVLMIVLMVFGCRLIWDSRATLCWHFKKQLKLTLLVCLRILTCVQFMRRGSPSCLKISSWLVVSVENVLRILFKWNLVNCMLPIHTEPSVTCFLWSYCLIVLAFI